MPHRLKATLSRGLPGPVPKCTSHQHKLRMCEDLSSLTLQPPPLDPIQLTRPEHHTDSAPFHQCPGESGRLSSSSCLASFSPEVCKRCADSQRARPRRTLPPVPGTRGIYHPLFQQLVSSLCTQQGWLGLAMEILWFQKS